MLSCCPYFTNLRYSGKEHFHLFQLEMGLHSFDQQGFKINDDVEKFSEESVRIANK